MMEIERKFLVDANKLLSSIDLSNCKSYKIKQAYISTEDNEVRIRKVDNNEYFKYFLTIKSKGSLQRKEIETEIPYKTYSDLMASEMYKGNIIEKIRYEILLENGLVAELDIYDDEELYGLITVEVEFNSSIGSENFQIPKWFGEEVTKDKRFKNRNLALDGNPIK